MTKALILFEYCYDIDGQKMAQEVLNYTAAFDYQRVACIDFRLGIMKQYGDYRDPTYKESEVYIDSKNRFAQSRIVPEDRQLFIENCQPDTVISHVKGMALMCSQPA